MLYAGELAINTDLWQLTRHTIQLNDVELTNFTGSVDRPESDSSFNFDYIIEAFAGDTTPHLLTRLKLPGNFPLKQFLWKKFECDLTIELMGNDIGLQVGILDVDMEEFDLEKSIMKADEINIENLTADISQTRVTTDTMAIRVARFSSNL